MLLWGPLLLGLAAGGIIMRRLGRGARVRALVGTLTAANGTLALVGLGGALLFWLADPTPALALALLQETGAGAGAGSVAIGAALATGLAAIGAGIAVGIAGAAAIGAITEKPETLGRTLIFVGLAEGIAIYGLIISFMILQGGGG
ncbi:MAG: ATP synthase subunit C [Candidatus Longimicrobiales bacterium M2_2A_002]